MHEQFGVRAAGVGQRGVSFRQSRAQCDLRPGFSNTDFSIVKNLALGGTARLQFRIEMFNIFNQANFGLPGRTAAVGSTSFGVITNTRFPTGDSGSARQVQFAFKALF